MKQTFQPHTKRRKRRLGFLSRSKSASGRRILKNRRSKGRKRLAL
ncbi:MAG: 50S ribosomal protein L34 [Thermovirgaceae bacterium]